MIVFIAAGSFGSLLLSRYATANYGAANTAADLRVDVGELIDISDELDVADPATFSRLDAVPELQQRIEHELIIVGRSALDNSDWAPIAVRVRAFLVSAATERSLSMSEQTAAAGKLGHDNHVASENLQQEVGTALVHLRAWADRAARLAQIGLFFVSAVMVGAVVVALSWDGRRRQRAERDAAEQRNRARFEKMVEHGSDLLVLTDTEGNQLYVSPALDHVLGYPLGSLVASRIPELIHVDDLPVLGVTLERARDTGKAGPIDLRMMHGEGCWRTIETVVVDMTHIPEVGGFLWTARDVTDRRTLEGRLERQALTDSLTGLANRALFRDHLEHAAVRAGRDRPFAVLLADVDGFKAINDRLGHDAGDEALVEIATRIASCARRSDTVARLGGDEFAVLLDDLAEPADAASMAGRIIDVLRQPVRVADTDVQIGISIGVCCPIAVEASSALRNADVAMYEAKLRGRGQYVVFEPAMHARAQEQLTLATDLAEAIVRDQLDVHYQPTYLLADRSIEGTEALLRWRHPDRGLIPPAMFIRIAERNDQILTIGRWVLERACLQAREWAERFPSTPARTMSVNLSGRQLSDASLVADVAAIVAITGVDPRSIILEITESVLMDDIDTTIVRLHQLKDLGVRLAIDDFGTGYSSLAYLRQFPVDILKIDRSFVAAAARGVPGGQALLRTLIDLAASLNLETVGEGVEDEAEAAQLYDAGCHIGQGFLFSPALPAEELTTLLHSLPLQTSSA